MRRLGRAAGIAALLAAFACDGGGKLGGTPAPTAFEHLVDLLDHGERFSGSDALAASAESSAEALDRAGLDTLVQTYRFPRYEVSETSALQVEVDGRVSSLDAFPVFYTAPLPVEVEAPVVRASDAAGPGSLSGVFLLSAHDEVTESLSMAREQGALAVVVSTDRRPLYTGQGLFATGLDPRRDLFPCPRWWWMGWTPWPIPALASGFDRRPGSWRARGAT